MILELVLPSSRQASFFAHIRESLVKRLLPQLSVNLEEKDLEVTAAHMLLLTNKDICYPSSGINT